MWITGCKGAGLSRENSLLPWESRQDMKMTWTQVGPARVGEMNVSEKSHSWSNNTRGNARNISVITLENAFQCLAWGVSFNQIILSWSWQNQKMEKDDINFRHACGSSKQRSLVGHWLWAWTQGTESLVTNNRYGNQQKETTEAKRFNEITQRDYTEGKVSWEKELDSTEVPTKMT